MSVVTAEQWGRLKHGDFLIAKNGEPRLVLEGPADEMNHPKPAGSRACTFPIWRVSWTRKPYTVKFLSCARLGEMRVPTARERKAIGSRTLCDLELSRQLSLGFDYVKEMWKSAHEMERIAASFGRKLNLAERHFIAKTKRLLRREWVRRDYKTFAMLEAREQ